MNTFLYYSRDFFKFSFEETAEANYNDQQKCQKCDCNFSNTVADINALFIIAHDSHEALKV